MQDKPSIVRNGVDTSVVEEDTDHRNEERNGDREPTCELCKSIHGKLSYRSDRFCHCPIICKWAEDVVGAAEELWKKMDVNQLEYTDCIAEQSRIMLKHKEYDPFLAFLSKDIRESLESTYPFIGQYWCDLINLAGELHSLRKAKFTISCLQLDEYLHAFFATYHLVETYKQFWDKFEANDEYKMEVCGGHAYVFKDVPKFLKREELDDHYMEKLWKAFFSTENICNPRENIAWRVRAQEVTNPRGPEDDQDHGGVLIYDSEHLKEFLAVRDAMDEGKLDEYVFLIPNFEYGNTRKEQNQ